MRNFLGQVFGADDFDWIVESLACEVSLIGGVAIELMQKFASEQGFEYFGFEDFIER
jgi:hypothetical protein